MNARSVDNHNRSFPEAGKNRNVSGNSEQYKHIAQAVNDQQRIQQLQGQPNYRIHRRLVQKHMQCSGRKVKNIISIDVKDGQNNAAKTAEERQTKAHSQHDVTTNQKMYPIILGNILG